MIYFSVYLLFGLFYFIKISISTNNRKYDALINNALTIYIPAIILILISGLRAQSVGLDTRNYGEIFLETTFENVVESNTPVYTFYSFIVNIIFHSNVIFNLFNSIFIIVSVTNFIKKYSTDPLLSFCLFLSMSSFFNSMNQCREYLAISVMLWAFNALCENRYIIYFILSLIAFGIHNVIIALVIVMFVSKFIKQINLKNMMIIITVLVFVMMFYEKLITLFVSVFPSYAVYMQKWVGFFSSDISLSRVMYICVLIIILILQIHLYKSKSSFFKWIITGSSINSFEKIFFVIAIVSNICLTVISFKIALILRIVMEFDLFTIVILPSVLKKTIKPNFAVKILIYFTGLVYMYLLLKSDGSGIAEYNVFWNE